ncbi:MAG: histidine kinase [Cyclobacteriaceae bacterium]|nr:histidine kinase [Cyclobacteriaceae bacterium]
MKINWHNLFLSDELRYKLPRHILFWTMRIIFLIGLTLINYDMAPWHERVFHVKISLVKLLLEILFCYSAIYWLVPQYLLKEKYVAFGAGFLFTSVINNSLLHLFLYWFLPADDYPGFYVMAQAILSNFVTWIGLPICVLVIAYKMLKIWYLKEEEKTHLTISNTNAELLLLKAQVHPHFLFNTLNNIYFFALYKSPTAGELLENLSQIIRYMTQECENGLVPLEKELKMLKDYIGLEKVRYSNRLELQIKITGEAKDKLIVPLLMIPFLENSFKHGASQMLENPRITLDIKISDENMCFTLSNSKPIAKNLPPEDSQPQFPSASLKVIDKHGLGLKNVKRRLEIIYPTTHTLKISSDQEKFDVFLEIPLEKIQVPSLSLTHAVDGTDFNPTPKYARL